MKQTLIIIRGAPSSGKSTIAKSLRNYEKKIVWLKVDNFKLFFSESSDNIIDDVNKIALDSLDYLLEYKFSVIMEGVFQNPRYIQEAIALAKQRNITAFVYKLECSIETLQARDKTREGIKEGCRKPLGDNVIERLYNIIENNPYDESLKLNTENESVNECMKRINKHFD